MRKDSEIFLEKCLQYRGKIGKDAFEIGINYFSEIPNIEVEIDEIIEELKKCNCISRKSEHVGENIRIYIILDGITYFNDYKGNEQRIAININRIMSILPDSENGRESWKQKEMNER